VRIAAAEAPAPAWYLARFLWDFRGDLEEQAKVVREERRAEEELTPLDRLEAVSLVVTEGLEAAALSLG
jgi:hypothetical protein